MISWCITKVDHCSHSLITIYGSSTVALHLIRGVQYANHTFIWNTGFKINMLFIKMFLKAITQNTRMNKSMSKAFCRRTNSVKDLLYLTLFIVTDFIYFIHCTVFFISDVCKYWSPMSANWLNQKYKLYKVKTVTSLQSNISSSNYWSNILSLWPSL